MADSLLLNIEDAVRDIYPAGSAPTLRTIRDDMREKRSNL